MQMPRRIHFKLNRTAVTGAFMGFQIGHGLYPAVYYSFYAALYASLTDYKYCFAKVGDLLRVGERLGNNIKTENGGFSAARKPAIQIAKGTDFHKARLAHHTRRGGIFFMTIQ